MSRKVKNADLYIVRSEALKALAKSDLDNNYEYVNFATNLMKPDLFTNYNILKTLIDSKFDVDIFEKAIFFETYHQSYTDEQQLIKYKQELEQKLLNVNKVLKYASDVDFATKHDVNEKEKILSEESIKKHMCSLGKSCRECVSGNFCSARFNMGPINKINK